MSQQKNNYNKWRENEIKRIGLDAQLKAEAGVEKHYAQPFVEVLDDKSGKIKAYRQDVAEVKMRRGQATRRKSYFFGGFGK